MLTDNTKEDFEKWLEEKKETSNEWYVGWGMFNIIPFSAQYGVYEDFFDRVGIILDVQPMLSYNAKCFTSVTNYLVNVTQLNSTRKYNVKEKNSREKARTEAIKKANIIYNGKNNIHPKLQQH